MTSETQDMLAHKPSRETREFLARRPLDQRTTIHQAHRRPLGLDPDAVLTGVSVIGLVLAIVLFATGAWIAGVIVFVLATTSIALLAVAVRREPNARFARPGHRALTSAAGFLQFALRAGRAWAPALVSLAGFKRHRHRLRRELRGQLAPLGEAVYREDHARAERLKAQAARLDQAVEEADRQASAMLDRTRGEMRRERATVRPTETLPRLQDLSSRRPSQATSQPPR